MPPHKSLHTVERMNIIDYIATIKSVHSVSCQTLNGVIELQLSQKQKEQMSSYTTTKSSTPTYWEKKDWISSLPLSWNVTSGMCSALRPQSPSALFQTLPDENK